MIVNPGDVIECASITKWIVVSVDKKHKAVLIQSVSNPRLKRKALDIDIDKVINNDRV